MSVCCSRTVLVRCVVLWCVGAVTCEEPYRESTAANQHEYLRRVGREIRGSNPGTTSSRRLDVLPLGPPEGWSLLCAVLWLNVLHTTVLLCTVLYCTVLLCSALYCALLHCTAHYCTVLSILCSTLLYCIVLYFGVLYGTFQSTTTTTIKVRCTNRTLGTLRK